LASLLKELRALTADELAAVLNEAAGEVVRPQKKKSTSPKQKKSTSKDSPIARIASVLRSSRGLSDGDAQRWLAFALTKDGVDSTLIPAPSEALHLEAWLERLLQSVRSAVVFDVATAGIQR
jgi:aryl-alcohol dehydrogenase-like predicted oxidoreductase